MYLNKTFHFFILLIFCQDLVAHGSTRIYVLFGNSFIFTLNFIGRYKSIPNATTKNSNNSIMTFFTLFTFKKLLVVHSNFLVKDN